MASVLRTFNPVAKNATNFAKFHRMNFRYSAVKLWHRNSTWELASKCRTTTLFQYFRGCQYSPITDSRPFHTSEVRQDLDTAGKAVGAGMAAVGIGGAGVGVGVVFSGLLMSYSRNPSLKQQLFSYAILGFALTEAMGLFSMALAVLILMS